MDDFNDAAIETDSNQFEKPNSTDQILKSHAHKLPTGALLHPHVEKDTHTLKVCHPSDRKVPISISLAVPHRDCQEHVAVYSHSMLILFKPWHNASNLHNPGQTWQEAFIQFKEECLPQYLEIMINMQLLHKCKDSCNDHFAQHRSQKYKISQELISTSGCLSDNFLADTDESDILDHLNTIDACHSIKSIHSMDEVNQCLKAAEESGFFSSGTTDDSAMDVDLPDIEAYAEGVMNQSLDLKATWELEYEKR